MKKRLFSIVSIVLVLLAFFAFNAASNGNANEPTRAIMV